MSRTRSKQPSWEPGPLPDGLLNWRDGRHYDGREAQPCTLCGSPTPLRAHSNEPLHKTCAEAWIADNPAEARTGRFASDTQAAGRRHSTDHA